MIGAPELYAMESTAPTCAWVAAVKRKLQHPQLQLALSRRKNSNARETELGARLVVDGVELGDDDAVNEARLAAGRRQIGEALIELDQLVHACAGR